jgi:glycosidase
MSCCTRGTPWLRASRDGAGRNVEQQTADAESVFNFYRSLLKIRRSSRALTAGDFQALDANTGVLAYTLTNAGERLLAVMNFTDRGQDALVRGAGAGAAAVLLGSHRQAGAAVAIPSLRLQSLESVILQL